MRRDEFNKAEAEYNAEPQTSVRDELNAAKTPAEAQEFQDVAEYPFESKPKKSSSSRRNSKLLQTLSAFAAIAVVAGAAVALPSDDVSASIKETFVTDTSVEYAVFVEEGEGLNLVLYNDFTRRSVALKKGENSGLFTNLKEEMDYTLAVVGNFGFGEKKIAKTSVKTLPPLITEWHGLTHECTCDVDGYFHFNMDFVDENGYWTKFRAWLKDENGNLSYCEFGEDLHGDQKIDVVEAGLVGKTATFTLECLTSNPSAAEEIIVLYCEQVKI